MKSFRFLFASCFLSIMSAFAQDDVFITVSAPPAGKTAPKTEPDGVFTTVSASTARPVPVAAPVSAPAVPAAQPVPVVKPVEQPAVTVASPVTPSVPPADSKNKSNDQWEQELLRDPFWPVGYFPENWKKKMSAQSVTDLDGTGWKAAAGKIRISGTSKLGGRTAAIINGDLKSTGDLVQIIFEGKTYQWQVVGIDADGQVQLKKQGIK